MQSKRRYGVVWGMASIGSHARRPVAHCTAGQGWRPALRPHTSRCDARDLQTKHATRPLRGKTAWPLCMHSALCLVGERWPSAAARPASCLPCASRPPRRCPTLEAGFRGLPSCFRQSTRLELVVGRLIFVVVVLVEIASSLLGLTGA